MESTFGDSHESLQIQYSNRLHFTFFALDNIDMTKQPEAPRLADELDEYSNHVRHSEYMNNAATELRRLHEVNVELLEVLEAAKEHLDYVGYGDSWERECAHDARLPERIESAIAKATGKTE